MGAEPKTRSWPFASPYPPFLGFGPLDVWRRLLFRPRPVIPFRYRPRLAVGLLMSVVLTVLTLPERLVLALWLRLCGPALDRGRPGPVVILGYYRSGTTFLQFLMNCDPNLYSPRWSQCFSPQGFWFSWTFLRFFLTPFLSESRPQDDLAFGPDVPGEDDFALCNGALASSLVGRHVLPRLRDFYDRFHDLKGLTPEERGRWRRCQLGFVRKLWLLAGGRRVLLKTPSHTARVEELQHLFAATDGVRFVHISRDPLAVVRSNLGLHRSLNPICHLQDPISEEEQERRTVAEYLATEQSYLAAKAHVSPGRLSEMRMEDLRADPIGELRRVYAELSLPFTEAFGRRLLEYLDTTRDYKPNKHPDWDAEQTRRLKEQLAPLVKQFRHDEPAVPKVAPPRPATWPPGAASAARLGRRGRGGDGGAVPGAVAGVRLLLPRSGPKTSVANGDRNRTNNAALRPAGDALARRLRGASDAAQSTHGRAAHQSVVRVGRGRPRLDDAPGNRLDPRPVLDVYGRGDGLPFGVPAGDVLIGEA